MANQFSVGVVIGGLIGSTFRSAVSGTRRALDSLGIPPAACRNARTR